MPHHILTFPGFQNSTGTLEPHDWSAKETAEVKTSMIKKKIAALDIHTNMSGFNLQGFTHLLSDEKKKS